MDALRLISIYQGKAEKHVTNGRWYIGSNNIPLPEKQCDRLVDEGCLSQSEDIVYGYFIKYNITDAGYRKLGQQR